MYSYSYYDLYSYSYYPYDSYFYYDYFLLNAYAFEWVFIMAQ